MKATYGQKAEGFTEWKDFEKELANRLNGFFLMKFTSKDVKLAKSLFKKGYTVSDIVSFLILNH